MTTRVVYPNARYVGTTLTSLVVYAQDGVTLIPQDGASVTDSDYYRDLFARSILVDRSPFTPAGAPIDLVIPTIHVVGGPGTAGQELVLIDADTAEFADSSGGGSTTGLLYADLAARPIVLADDQLVFYCTGRLVNNDGGEGQFYADFGSVATADGATVISATGGRYIRIRSSDIVNPGWFGFSSASTAADNTTALTAALNAARGGVKVPARAGYTPVDVSTMISVSTGSTLSGMQVDGLRIHKTTAQASSSDPGAVLHFGQAPSVAIDNLTLRNAWIQGAGANTDICKGVQFGFIRRSRVENLHLTNQVMEGLYYPGPASCRYNWVTNSMAEDVGNALHPATPLSAFNINTSWVIAQGLQAYNVGRFIEHTGHNAVVANFIFEKSAYGVPGIMCQSTTYHNRGFVLANGIVIDSDLAAGVADNQRSHGLLYMGNLVLNQCRAGLQLGSKPTSQQPNVIDGVLAIDASSRLGLTDSLGGTGQGADAVVQLNTGGHVVEHVKVARPESTTTGEIQIGNLSRMLVPTTTTLMHTLSIGSTFEIAGSAGTKTVTNVSATATYDYAPPDRIDFTPPAAGAVAAGAAVTYRPCPWLYLVRCQTSEVNDYFTLQRWTIIDVPFSSVALHCRGWRWTMKDFTFQPRGKSYAGIDLVRAVDVANAFNAPNTLSCTQIDVTRKFCLSYTERSEFTSTGVPNTGTWKVGDICWYTAPAAGGYMGEVCVTSGSNGTLPGAVTATTSIGSPNVTISGPVPLGICVDNWITIAGEFGGAAVRVLPGSTSSTLIVSANASVGVAGAAVALSASVWKTFGAVTP